MEGDPNQMSQQSPSLCRSGCGFYGSPKTDGLCSKCYKDALKRKQANPAASASPASLASSNTAASTNAAAAAVQGRTSPSSTGECGAKSLLPKEDDLSTASPTVPAVVVTPPSQEQNKPELQQQCGDGDKGEGSSSQQQDEEKDQKKKKNRCHICKKKVGLTGFTCRCSGLFCSVHRYSNEHNCSFDYKQLGAQEIRKNNPLVVGEKVKKI